MHWVGNGAVGKAQKGRENRVFLLCWTCCSDSTSLLLPPCNCIYLHMCQIPALLTSHWHSFSRSSHITTSDISILSQVLSLLTQPCSDHNLPHPQVWATQQYISNSAFPSYVQCCLDALLMFFFALVWADLQIAIHVMLNAVTVEKGQRTDANVMNSDYPHCLDHHSMVPQVQWCTSHQLNFLSHTLTHIVSCLHLKDLALS